MLLKVSDVMLQCLSSANVNDTRRIRTTGASSMPSCPSSLLASFSSVIRSQHTILLTVCHTKPPKQSPHLTSFLKPCAQRHSTWCVLLLSSSLALRPLLPWSASPAATIQQSPFPRAFTWSSTTPIRPASLQTLFTPCFFKAFISALPTISLAPTALPDRGVSSTKTQPRMSFALAMPISSLMLVPKTSRTASAFAWKKMPPKVLSSD